MDRALKMKKRTNNKKQGGRKKGETRRPERNASYWQGDKFKKTSRDGKNKKAVEGEGSLPEHGFRRQNS